MPSTNIFDVNKAFENVLGGVSNYFDRKLFTSNPEAARAYYGSLSGSNRPNTGEQGPTSSTPPRTVVDAGNGFNMSPTMMVVLGVAAVGAVVVLAK